MGKIDELGVVVKYERKKSSRGLKTGQLYKVCKIIHTLNMTYVIQVDGVPYEWFPTRWFTRASKLDIFATGFYKCM